MVIDDGLLIWSSSSPAGTPVAVCAWSARELWRRRAPVETQVVWLLTATSLIYCAFTAVGRLPVNIEAAFMWRYLTLMIPAIAGVIIFAEHHGSSETRVGLRRALAAGSLGLALIIWGNLTPERYAMVIARAKILWIENYQATHDLAATNQRADFSVLVGDPDAPVIAERLRWLEARRLSFFKEAATIPSLPEK